MTDKPKDPAGMTDYAAIARELVLIAGVTKRLKERDRELRSAMVSEGRALRAEGILPKTGEVTVNGTKVGTATLSSGRDWRVADEDAWEAWAVDAGYALPYWTIDTRRLDAEQAGLLKVWAQANHVWLEPHVAVDPAASEAAIRIGDRVVSKDTGEEIPGTAVCEPELKPMIRVPKPDVLFAAMGGSATVLPAGAVEQLPAGEVEDA